MEYPINKSLKHSYSLGKKWVRYLYKNPFGIKWLLPYFLNLNASTLERRKPWISYDAIYFLEQYLRKEHIVFEWGSGGSTLFFADRTKHIVSIEHNKEWYDAVADKIRKESITNIDYRLIGPDKNLSSDELATIKKKNILLDFTDNKSSYRFLLFESYVKNIDHYNDEYFDIILIDGRSRPSCILRSLSKLKRNGLLIVDNSERIAYKAALEQLKDWTVQSFYGPVCCYDLFSQTSIYIKP